MSSTEVLFFPLVNGFFSIPDPIFVEIKKIYEYYGNIGILYLLKYYLLDIIRQSTGRELWTSSKRYERERALGTLSPIEFQSRPSAISWKSPAGRHHR